MAENPHGVNIDMSQFTTNVREADEYTVKGDGIFDILMNTATTHLQVQFKGGRIRAEEYATFYAQYFQMCLQAATQIWLQKPVQKAQEDLLAAQAESELAKKDLYYRQIEGFDEDYIQKILKILMDSWAVGFSVARDMTGFEIIPAPMQRETINDFYNQFVKENFDRYRYGRNIRETNTP